MKFRSARALTLGIVAAFALAACGSSSKATVSPNAQPSATTDTTSAPGAAASTPVVKTASVGTVGTVLVDETGLTLYTLTSGGKPVACTGQCATFWPPLVLPAGTTSATGATGVTGLGTASANGGMQVTSNGDPLYRFSKDTGPGVAMGEGLASFGGVWHVVKASGSTASAPVPTPTPTSGEPATTPPTTSSYGGGGY
jgi:predicted lipoprotein with Yx(FWY)xxD motif